MILQPPGTELWVRGEVAGLDPAAGRVEAVTEEVSREWVEDCLARGRLACPRCEGVRVAAAEAQLCGR